MISLSVLMMQVRSKRVLAIETDITMREEAEMALDQRVP
jgi:hypothetical protein